MTNKTSLIALSLLGVILTGGQAAASCLTGTCHKNLTTTKYLHGPVAAEQAGVQGCVACHVPAGKACSQTGKGAFKPLASATQMCQICHSRGTGTQHSIKNIDCLKCHDPHGSDKNIELNR